MAKKIDTVYTDNPSAGNDPSINYKFASSDGSTDAIALDMDQVAAAVAVRIGTSLPPVDTENLAQLVITIQNNTLVPNVQPITGVDYTHYIVVTDSDVVPTYPTGFSQGPLPSLLPALASWDAETKYIYLYDLPTTTLKTLTNSNGESGITVRPNDTLGPVFDPDSLVLSAGTEPTTDIVATFDLGVDAGIGYYRADLHDSITDALVQTSITSGSNITGFKAGTAYTFYVRQYDLSGNYTASNPKSILTSEIAGTDSGTIQFTASSFEEDEDVAGGNMVITLARTGSTTGAIQVTVSTADDTAEAGVNYTAVSSDVISWGDGVGGTQNMTIPLTDDSSLSNKQFFAYIDDASNTDGASNPVGVIGPINSVLCKINSSVAGGVVGFQPDASGVICIEAETTNKTITVGGTGATWTQDSEIPVEYSNGLQMKSPPSDYGNSTTIDHTNGTVLNYEVVLANEDYDVWIRGYYHRDTNRYVHGNLDWDGASSEVASLKGFDFGYYGDGSFGAYVRRWVSKTTVFSGSLPSAGAHTFNLHCASRSTEIDKIILAPSSLSYDASLYGDPGGAADGRDENMGIDQTSYTTTAAIEDDPNNSTTPITPPPAGTVSPTLYPLDGAINVSTSSVMILTFAGTLPTSTTFNVAPTGGSNISGSVIVGSQTIIFSPSIPLTNGIEYTATATGTVRDTDGVPKSYSESWTFNTAITDAGDVVFLQDFSTARLGVQTQADIITLFNANLDDGNIVVSNVGTGQSTVHIVADPKGSSSRGNVMRVTHPAGEYAAGTSWKCRFSPDNTNKTGSKRYDDVYLSFDVYYGTIDGRTFEWQTAHKGMRLIAGTLLQASHESFETPVPEGIDSFNNGIVLYNEASFTRAPPPMAVNYTYDAQAVNENSFLNTSDPEEDIDVYSSANVGKYYTMTDKVWHNIVIRAKMNTADATGGTAATAGDYKDGLSEIWIDGVKLLSRCHMWRWINDLKCDGFWLQEYFNVRTNTPAVSVDHYVYYDNIKASTTAPDTAPGPGRSVGNECVGP